MRYLGLDLGTTSLGVAISDKTNTLVSPLTLIKFKKEDYNDALNKLMEIIKDKNISKVVLGLPKNMDNSLGWRSTETIEFKKKLEKMLDKEVILEDERLTTKIAENMLIDFDLSRKKRKKVIDGVSAVIILQSYLDRKER